MSNSFMNKLKSWVSGDPFEDEVFGFEEEFDAEPRTYARTPRPEFDMSQTEVKKRKPLKVVEHPSNQLTQVVVIEPRAFEESLEIIEHLRTKKSVVLNLHLLDTAQSQRVVDFLSGATHAIDGNQQRIGDGVFMFTPNNVMITSEAAKATNINLTEAFWNHAR